MIQPSRSGSHLLMASPEYFTCLASSSSASLGSSTRVVVNGFDAFGSPAGGCFSSPRIVCSPMVTSATSPFFTSVLNSL